MSFVIVPDSLRHAINEKLDAAYLECPDAERDRDAHYHELLRFFHENGFVPEFSLQKNENG